MNRKDRRLIKLVREIGLDPEFIRGLGPTVAETFILNHMRTLMRSFHPDAHLNIKISEDFFKTFQNLQPLVKENLTNIWRACKGINNNGDILPILHQEEIDHLNETYHREAESLKELVFSDYQDNLSDHFANKLIFIRDPNPLDIPAKLAKSDLLNVDWFSERLERENQSRRVC